mmetsp:Transcript_21900/g.37583  ORF Transcript_21900/g.37583 Transcript_21900/m.37583 type:complete len:249 (+) Transcript_21900:116-862(+)
MDNFLSKTETNSCSVPKDITFPVTPLLPSAAAPESEVTALRRNVETLKEENQALKNEIANLKKRVATAGASAGAPPSKKARTPGQKKKLFGKWANALARESKKKRIMFDMFAPDAYTITVKDSGLWAPHEFHGLFDGHGEKIQPTPENKPNSVVTILRFNRFEDVKDFFEAVGGAEIEEIGYQVELWGKRRFGKSYHYDTADARLLNMEVHYNKNKQTLSLAFEMVYGGLLRKKRDRSEESSVSGESD